MNLLSSHGFRKNINSTVILKYLQPEIFFLFIRKHKYFLPLRGNLAVVCNLKDVRYSISSNGVNRVVTHEWMSSIFEMLFLF